MASELKQKVVRSAGWLGIGQVYSQIMSVVVTAGILAPLLGPEAFGLLGMVAVFTAFLELFKELGLSHAIIQRQDTTEEQLSTVFFITVVCGALLALLTAAAGPLIAAFYQEPLLASVAKLMGLNFLISSFVQVHASLVLKALKFRKLVLIRIISRLASSAVGITMALLGFGVYALVFQGLVGELVFSASMWAAVRWRPSAKPRLGSVLGLLRFGGNATGSSFLVYLSSNAHSLLIGRVLGASALGIYSLAYRIMLLPIRRVTSQICQVAFPTFSSVQDDKARVRRGFTQMTNKIALFAFPAMAGLLIVAPEAVPVVLSSKWLRCIFIIQVLSLIGALHSVTASVWTIFRSQGRADLQFRYEVLSTAVVLGALGVGLRWDIEGIAVCYAIAQAVLVPGKCYLAFRLIDLKFSEYYRSLRVPLLATLGMVATVFGFRMLATLIMDLSDLPLLCGQVGLGVLAYIVGIILLAPRTYAEVVGILRLLSGKAQKAEAGQAMVEEGVQGR